MIACILLSAGFSSRFGSPKALAAVSDHQNVMQKMLSELIASSVQDVVVVLGAGAQELKPHVLNHKKIRVVYNKDHKFGQTTSFQTGLRVLENTAIKGVMCLPVDYPFLSASILDQIVNAFLAEPCPILIPVYEERRGHPPVFHYSLREELLGLDHTMGINTLIHKYATQTKNLPVEDQGVILTFNTPAELDEIKKRRH